MFRFAYGSLALNLMFLSLCFSFNFKEDDPLSQSFIGRENWTNETREFAANIEENLSRENLTYETREFAANMEEKISITDYPYMAAITVGEYHAYGYHGMNCTGVFIRENIYILTAGRCLVYRMGAKQYIVHTSTVKVRYGSQYHHRGGQTGAKVDLVKVHPNFFKNGLGISSAFDFGVIRIKHENELQSEVKDIKVMYTPKSLDDSLYSEEVGRYPCSVVGYGITPNSQKDNSLVKVQVNMITREECLAWVKPLNLKIDFDDICVFRSGVDPCRGDGGAVLFCTPKINGPFGIFGFGVNCGMPKRPAVFSRTDRSYNYLQQMASYDIFYTAIKADPLFADWKENLDEGFEVDSSGKPIKPKPPKKPKKPGDSTNSPEDSSEMDDSRAASFGLNHYLFLLIVTSWENN